MMVLHGYGHSVYTRAARLALAHCGSDHRFREVNPFAPPLPDGCAHPFGRVPVLDHDGTAIYETRAILAYIATACPGPSLVPAGPLAQARMEQVMSVIDGYLYRPLVRQVYAHAVFHPAFGDPADPQTVADGMDAAPRVLAALEAIAAERLVLAPDGLTLADFHLAPMIDAFRRHPPAAELFDSFPALAGWWRTMAARPEMAATAVALPDGVA